MIYLINPFDEEDTQIEFYDCKTKTHFDKTKITVCVINRKPGIITYRYIVNGEYCYCKSKPYVVLDSGIIVNYLYHSSIHNKYDGYTWCLSDDIATNNLVHYANIAHKCGDIEILYKLALIEYTNKNMGKFVKILSQYAQYNTSTYILLGKLYTSCDMIHKFSRLAIDDDLAIQYFKKAADNGHYDVISILGYLYKTYLYKTYTTDINNMFKYYAMAINIYPTIHNARNRALINDFITIYNTTLSPEHKALFIEKYGEIKIKKIFSASSLYYNNVEFEKLNIEIPQQKHIKIITI